MKFGVGFFEERGDYVGALQAVRGFCLAWARFFDGAASLRIAATAGAAVSTGAIVACNLMASVLLGLIDEAGVLLIAFGGEADVVELNFIGAGLGYEFGQRDAVVLNFGIRRISPDQFAVLAPRLLCSLGLHGEFGMLGYHARVAEDGDPGDGVHVFGVQEVDKLGQVVDIDLVFVEQRMLEGDVYVAVAIFDIEDDGVAAYFAPVTDDADSVVAGGHDTSEVDGADFKVFGDRNRFFDNGRGKNSWDGNLLARFEDVAGAVAIVFSVGSADGFG